MSNTNGDRRILSVQFGRRRIEYALQYSRRKTLAIDVHPDLSVIATAPIGSSDEAVVSRVQKRAGWIFAQQRFFETYLPTMPRRLYISGESHRYLGRQYRLRVQQGNAESIKISRGQINVTLNDMAKKERVKALVTGWFRSRAEVVFTEVFEASKVRAARHGITADSFSIRRMKNRWGSCNHNGNILLNPDLILAPLMCIEYVIVHELCHLKEHNHSSKFYRLLDRMMPDWQQRRERLNRCIAQ